MKTIAKAFAQLDLQKLKQAFALLCFLIAIPLLIHSQWYTGTLVNSILILTLLTIGLREAMLFCFVPSVVVFATGSLPSPLLPIIPFIIISNLILVLAVYWGERQKIALSLSIGGASILKYLFLSGALTYIISFFVAENLLLKVSVIFGAMQLLTALMGGILAILVIRLFRLEKIKFHE